MKATNEGKDRTLWKPRWREDEDLMPGFSEKRKRRKKDKNTPKLLTMVLLWLLWWEL